jgi:DNA-binding winged helix-turn-helix (wHTH) protein/tetratricopeptide (TPR) repeat protein
LTVSATQQLLRFGVFELNLATEELRKSGVARNLPPQPFRLLVLLATRTGEVVTREELQKEFWDRESDTDFERRLSQCIKQVRTALSDNASHPVYIETVHRQGYRFLAPVESRTIEAPTPGVFESPPSRPGGWTVPATTNSTAAGTATTRGAMPGEAVPADNAAAFSTTGRSLRIALLLGAVAAIAIVAAILYHRAHKRAALTEKDTIVLADFDNKTGDPVFDDTLRLALAIQLEQSPFLNVLSNSKVNRTLKLMNRPGSEPLTPDLAREVCLRTSSKAMLTGSIAGLGNEYVISLKAIDCNSGDLLAEAQKQAAGKSQVLKVMDAVAVGLRSELGESLSSVQTFETPLAEASTPSLEALNAYSAGLRAEDEKGSQAGLPHYQHAIELDPSFAMAYHAMANVYASLDELERSNEDYTKALELRDRANPREKLLITADYYAYVTGDLQKGVQTYQEMIASYPRSPAAYGNLATVFAQQGRHAEAVEMMRQVQRLDPTLLGSYANLASWELALGHLEESRGLIQEAFDRKMDDAVFHEILYALAFLASDSTGMSEQQQWFTANGDVSYFGLSLAADTQAYAGRMEKARDLTRRSVASAVRTNSKEAGAIWWESAAIREAAFGNIREARQATNAGMKLYPKSQGVRVQAALACAMSGDTARAQAIAQDLSKHYPLDTQVQSLWLPATRAQLALNRKNSNTAIAKLQPALPPLEYGSIFFMDQISCLYPTYIRGEAYLVAGEGKEAATQFQKILNHGGIVWNCWTGALARLGLARAYAEQGDKDKARVAYEEFLTLWKDADPDVPIYKEAKLEYAKLQ